MYELTFDFGAINSRWAKDGHHGRDFKKTRGRENVTIGAPAKSHMGGRVYQVGHFKDGNQFVKIIDDEGCIGSIQHLSEQTIHEGQYVKKGDVIGKMGDSGVGSGPHIHYDIALPYRPNIPGVYVYRWGIYYKDPEITLEDLN